MTDGFNRALQQHDYAALGAIYSNRYMLVRPDGFVLNKEQVLKDLIEHKVAFYPIDLTGVAVRLLGSTAILTAETTILSSRDGKHTYRHIRIVAVYAQEADAIGLVHVSGRAEGEAMKSANQTVREKPVIRTVELERFSLTTSKPLDQVVAAFNAAIGHPDI